VLAVLGVVILVVALSGRSNTGASEQSDGSAAAPYFTSSAPSVAPTPSIEPAAARITVHTSWTPGQDSYGDPITTAKITISTNIPMNFDSYITLTGSDGVIPFPSGDCDIVPQCEFKGSTTGSIECKRVCQGGLDLEILVCSYVQDVPDLTAPCAKQTDEYLTWVGHLGARLVGATQAVRDDQHPNITDLKYHVVLKP
jgi:hypothetical protein